MRQGFLFVALLTCVAPVAATQSPNLTIGPKTIAIDDGSHVEAEAGALQVPESRKRPTSRKVTLPYYRLKSTAAHPATPIFLLAGGPGSSWIERVGNAEYFREIAFYRTIADVVVFDQRGGGRALPAMDCSQATRLPVDRPLALADMRTPMRTLLIACRDHWQAQGVDLAAYNTVENAADVDALRTALGYDKVTLVGGSYGSHLGLQVMRQFPEAVDRVVLFGIEGPDHTYDNPAGRLATLQRIAEVAERSPALAGRIPAGGLLKVLTRVLQRLDKAPQTVTVTQDEKPITVVVDATLVRQIATREAGRRNAPDAWPEMILAMDRGDYSFAARMALRRRELRLQDPMHYSMDCASGVSGQRRDRYRSDPATALLGDINFEYEALCDVWPHDDLGAAFRADVVSDIRAVLFHGTWDTSTPIENAREVAATLRNSQLVEVIGGNHGALYNLYARWAPMRPLLRDFLAGKRVDFPDTVQLPTTELPPEQQQ